MRSVFDKLCMLASRERHTLWQLFDEAIEWDRHQRISLVLTAQVSAFEAPFDHSRPPCNDPLPPPPPRLCCTLDDRQNPHIKARSHTAWQHALTQPMLNLTNGDICCRAVCEWAFTLYTDGNNALRRRVVPNLTGSGRSKFLKLVDWFVNFLAGLSLVIIKPLLIINITSILLTSTTCICCWRYFTHKVLQNRKPSHF